MKKWVILVSQVVLGKSKAPEKSPSKGPKWSRHKPYPYSDSWEDHKILYSKSFSATEEDAKAEAERVNAAMFNTYIMGMGKTDNCCVKEYKVILHNASDDVSLDMGGTLKANAGQLWPNESGSFVSSGQLKNWGVIPYDPSNASYKILLNKQRKIT